MNMGLLTEHDMNAGNHSDTTEVLLTLLSKHSELGGKIIYYCNTHFSIESFTFQRNFNFCLEIECFFAFVKEQLHIIHLVCLFSFNPEMYKLWTYDIRPVHPQGTWQILAFKVLEMHCLWGEVDREMFRQGIRCLLQRWFLQVNVYINSNFYKPQNVFLGQY